MSYLDWKIKKFYDKCTSHATEISMVLVVVFIIGICIGMAYYDNYQRDNMCNSQLYKDGYDLGYKEHNQTRYTSCCNILGSIVFESTKIGDFTPQNYYSKDNSIFAAGYINGANAWLIREPIK
jgi:hypothetical protein